MKRIELDDQDPDLEHHIEWMRRIARRLTSSEPEAQDLVQDVCMEWLRAGPEDRGGGVRPWLAIILRRRASHVRRRDRARSDRERMAARSELLESHCEGIAQEDERQRLRQLVELLDPDTRRVASLCFLDGYTVSESARLLGLPRSTVQTRLARATAALARIYPKAPASPRRWSAWPGALVPFRRRHLAPRGALTALALTVAVVAVELAGLDSGQPPDPTVPSPGSRSDAGEAMVPIASIGPVGPDRRSPDGLTTTRPAPALEPSARLDRLLVALNQARVPSRTAGYDLTLLDAAGGIHRGTVESGTTASFDDLPLGPAVIAFRPRRGLLHEQEVVLTAETTRLEIDAAETSLLEVTVIQQDVEAVPPIPWDALELVANTWPEYQVDTDLHPGLLARQRSSSGGGRWNAEDTRVQGTRSVLRRPEADQVHLMLGSAARLATVQVPSRQPACILVLSAEDRARHLGSLRVKVLAAGASSPAGGATLQVMRWGRERFQATVGPDGTHEFLGVPAGPYLVEARSPDGLLAQRALVVEHGTNQVTLHLAPAVERPLRLTGDSTGARSVRVFLAHPLDGRSGHLTEVIDLDAEGDHVLVTSASPRCLRVWPRPGSRRSPWMPIGPAGGELIVDLQEFERAVIRRPELEHAHSYRMTATHGRAPANVATVESRHFLPLNELPGLYRIELWDHEGKTLASWVERLGPP